MTATNCSRDNHTYSLAVTNRLCDKFHVLVTYLTISEPKFQITNKSYSA